MKIIIFVALLIFSSLTIGQSSILLEACNNISDGDKRLACLQELMGASLSKSMKNQDAEKIKNSFASIKGSVNSGITYKIYSERLINLAGDLEVYRASSNADLESIEFFDGALQAYKDAGLIWHASIFKMQDAGFFGRVLSYKNLRLTKIVEKYRLPVTTIIGMDHLPPEQAVAIIWSQAAIYIDNAIRKIDGNSSGVSADGVSEKPSENKTRLVEKIFLRTGLKIAINTLKIIDVEEKSPNQKFDIGSVIEVIGGQPVSGLEQVDLIIELLKPGQKGYFSEVRKNGVVKEIFLEIN